MASTIKVDNVQNQPGNNLINRCSATTTVGSGAGNTINVDGATVTLGRCGGTVALASGATQTGFGRTGTVDWVTTVQTSTITAATGKGYFVNTTAGGITANLPAGAAGSIVSFADYAATWQNNALTISPNGTEKIGGVNSNVSLSTEGQSVNFVYIDSTQGWINTMDSTSNVRGNSNLVATGGNAVVTCGDYKTHIFTGPGTFTVCSVSLTAPENTVDYFVTAGGAGGGPSGGGPGSPAGLGEKGSNSIFSTVTSTGGGAGLYGAQAPAHPQTFGGSGGGAGAYNTSAGPGNNPPTTPAQGNNGGCGASGAPAYGAGGGGGAGAVGTNGSPSSSGAGGVGSYVADPFIGPTAPSYGEPGPVGSTRYFAGGGGGAGFPQASQAGAGGVGGGGDGNYSAGCNGVANTGGGGGGGERGGPATGGTGGSGLVMSRYKYQ